MYPASDVQQSREFGRPIRLTLVQFLRYVQNDRANDIKQACELFAAMIVGPLRKVPGADTATRMAERIGHGRTPEQAAAREYLYRWRLALDARPRNAAAVWGVPHTLGL
ncbi:hypothetical protein CcrColossus_gp002 [Caulobacter phage CcrColossus]|uniref:Uncharacterized protein n=1 Tax=Caulobacter phage CcrColossus TaxID=1211640 RepID=K4K5Y0_9CAUD|nr:hypothetical protein CcrColossus_gp002 [Caulobacter phage CcrColossus]AFU87872.1 hypothetical protein CcrColossus_gp002 [Caulobacter phage CcrColossus]